MTHIPFLEELLIVAAAGVLAALFLSRLKLPVITALLIAGALIGPHGVRFVKDLHNIEMVGSSRVDLQACKLEYSIVSPK